MTKDRPESVDRDASELPGAVVIRPERNPNMVYDPTTGRVIDTATGESFGASVSDTLAKLYRAGIRNAQGSPLYGYELRYGNPRNPDGSVKRVVWEVFWSIRSEDDRKSPTESIANREHAKNDSLERLAQFLRVDHEGLYKTNGRTVEGETVIVDRRMYDNSMEGMR